MHGTTELTVQSGASGAIIVEGIETVDPRVAGLPEHVFIFRDQVRSSSTNTRKEAPTELESTMQTDPEPAWDLSVNYVSILHPKYVPARFTIRPRERQFWRILNAGADVILNLRLLYDGKPQLFHIVARDGVPLSASTSGPVPNPSNVEMTPTPTPFHDDNDDDMMTMLATTTHLYLAPAARVELMVDGPDASVVDAILQTTDVDTGPDGDTNPVRPLIRLVIDPNAPPAPYRIPFHHSVPTLTPPPPTPPSSSHLTDPHFGDPWSSNVQRTRLLYFSEEPVNATDPDSDTQFYITEQGHTPTPYARQRGPAIHVQQGAIEDWTIENRSREHHVFHIHQLHFWLIARNNISITRLLPLLLLDTITIPYWSGNTSHSFPSVTLRMDFRSPHLVGTFLYHCHILEHEDKGMMAAIQVIATTTTTTTNTGTSTSNVSGARAGIAFYKGEGSGLISIFVWIAWILFEL